MNCCIVYLREGSDKSSRSRKVHGTNEECSLTRRRWWRRWRGLGQSVILSWGMTATFTSLLVISACLRLLPRMLIVCLQSLCLYIAMKSFHALLSSPRTRLSPKHAQPGVLTCTLQARPVPAARVQTRGSPQPLPPSPPHRRAAPVAAAAPSRPALPSRPRRVSCQTRSKRLLLAAQAHVPVERPPRAKACCVRRSKRQSGCCVLLGTRHTEQQQDVDAGGPRQRGGTVRAAVSMAARSAW